MDAKIGKFFESVGSFFSGGDQIPWCDSDIVTGCEREVAEAEKGSSDELKSECIMRLSWALVHSRRPEDVQRGIAMLEASLGGTNSPLQMREKIYLLAVGYYRSGDYARSRQLVERCLEIAPDWRQALSLQKTIEDKITTQSTRIIHPQNKMQVQLMSWHRHTLYPLPTSSILYGYRSEAAAGARHLHYTALRLNRNPNHRFRLITLASEDVNIIGDGDYDDEYDGVEIEIEKLGKRRRIIRSKIAVNASLQNVWDVLTDYERLAEFIPGLAVSQLLHKEPKFARLLQIGQQDLAFGLKFNAKGIVDCYEKDFEDLPIGQRRDIEFKMVEGDFKIFEGKWSIEQCSTGSVKECDSSVVQAFHTTLFYIVDVEPKIWLPVRVIEGRLCKEIKINLRSVRDEAQKVYVNSLSSY